MIAPLIAFECCTLHAPWDRRGDPSYRIVYAYTRGAAKADYWHRVRECWRDVPFTAVRARRAVRAPRRDLNLERVCASRGLPALAAGVSRVRVCGLLATVVGANGSANIEIIFDNGVKSCAHPGDLEVLA